jgi:hypothetical protein
MILGKFGMLMIVFSQKLLMLVIFLVHATGHLPLPGTWDLLKNGELYNPRV